MVLVQDKPGATGEEELAFLRKILGPRRDIDCHGSPSSVTDLAVPRDMVWRLPLLDDHRKSVSQLVSMAYSGKGRRAAVSDKLSGSKTLAGHAASFVPNLFADTNIGSHLRSRSETSSHLRRCYAGSRSIADRLGGHLEVLVIVVLWNVNF